MGFLSFKCILVIIDIQHQRWEKQILDWFGFFKNNGSDLFGVYT